MKKAILLAMVLITFACTKQSTPPSLKDSSTQEDVINAQHPKGIFKVCLNNSITDGPYYRVVLRYETNEIIPTGKLSYITSDGTLISSVYLPPYTRKAVVSLLIGKNSPVGYIQISTKGVVDTTVQVDGTNICDN